MNMNLQIFHNIIQKSCRESGIIYTEQKRSPKGTEEIKMTQYIVINNETGYYEEFYNLAAAKKAMKENNAKGSKWKIYSDGETVDCGEITLKGSNKTYIANSPRNMKKANY